MTSRAFDFPDNGPVTDSKGLPTLPWVQVFARWHRVVLSLQQSGATADRPTTGLWVGRTYFDTTLGKPVWVKSVGPAVWVDATGAVA